MTNGSRGVSYPTHDIAALVVEDGQGHEDVNDDEAAFKETHDHNARSSGLGRGVVPRAKNLPETASLAELVGNKMARTTTKEEKEKEAFKCVPCGLDDVTENAPIKVARDPGEPTTEMREQHFTAGHLPYRAWCPVCVMGKGKEDAHHRGNDEDSEFPHVVMDYKSFGQEIDIDDKATAIVMRDKQTTTTFAHICEKKGISDTFVVRELVADIDSLGHTKIILKGDGEPALVQLMNKIKQLRAHPTIVQNPPAYDPQANGAAEKAVQDYMGQLRALKIGLEYRLGGKIESHWPIMEWLSEHSPTTIDRGQMGHDGKVPYQRRMGKLSKKPMVEIGEQVLAKPLRSPKTTKRLSLKNRWVMGTWVGINRRTNEHIVALNDGGAAIRVRTVMRSSPGCRWSLDKIRQIRARPSTPNPIDDNQEEVLPERLTKGIEVEVDGTTLLEASASDELVQRRDFRITKGLIERYGFSAGCQGCEEALLGKRRRHSDECRARFEDEMVKEDLKNVIEKRNERLQKSGEPNEAKTEAEVQQDAFAKVDNDEDDETPDLVIEPPEEDEDRKRCREEDYVEDANSAANIPPTGKVASEAIEQEKTSKRRKLNLMASERRLLARVSPNRAQLSSRAALYKMLNQLEYGPNETLKTKDRGSKTDISAIIGALQDPEPTPHDDDNDRWWQELYAHKEFFDDMNGYRKLDKAMVIEARKLEMAYFKKMGVYRKVPRAKAVELGCKPITTKWLDTNKGDDRVPNYRSRLVGREIKKDARLDLFAATPPLETIKFLMSCCAKGQGRKDPLRMAVIDIKRAYFYAPVRRPVFIEIPDEDKEPGDWDMVGQLHLSLYGTRDAAQNWTAEYTRKLKEVGFAPGRASPCNFTHKSRGINLTVHGDDFAVVANSKQLQWFGEVMKSTYDIKMSTLGPDEGQVDEVRLLNRILRWTPAGLEYEADKRHAELIVKELGLESARSVSSPYPPEGYPAVEVSKSVQDDSEESTRYRGICARMNYLAVDRPDIQYTSKVASQWMAKPCEQAWEIIKRAGRYLKGAPRLVQKFPWENYSSTLNGFADSDWAGDRTTLKSTSGGAVVWGSHTLKTWATSQSTIALSSGEAELYAITKVAVQTSGIISLAGDFDVMLEGMIKTDSNAAIGIVHRAGLGGRCRHIRVQYLWIQEKIKLGELRISKVHGKENPADLMTKGLNGEEIAKHMKCLGFRVTSGRAEKSSDLNAIDSARNESDKWLPRMLGECWRRVHFKPRQSLFTPMKVARGPDTAEAVGKYRHTLAWSSDGRLEYLIDEWKNIAYPHRKLSQPFTGMTIFCNEPNLLTTPIF